MFAKVFLLFLMLQLSNEDRNSFLNFRDEMQNYVTNISSNFEQLYAQRCSNSSV